MNAHVFSKEAKLREGERRGTRARQTLKHSLYSHIQTFNQIKVFSLGRERERERAGERALLCNNKAKGSKFDVEKKKGKREKKTSQKEVQERTKWRVHFECEWRVIYHVQDERERKRS